MTTQTETDLTTAHGSLQYSHDGPLSGTYSVLSDRYYVGSTLHGDINFEIDYSISESLGSYGLNGSVVISSSVAIGQITAEYQNVTFHDYQSPNSGVLIIAGANANLTISMLLDGSGVDIFLNYNDPNMVDITRNGVTWSELDNPGIVTYCDGLLC